jgi:predicted ATPase/DNA-binding CsgD family transcriptional regulator
VLTGRREELAEVRRRLTGSGRLVTLTGTAGSGKTVLARAVADEHRRAGAGEVCRLEPGALGAGSDGGVGREADRLAAAVAERDVLLVLDGCDASFEESALLADTLLKRCPRLRVLATARRPLGVAGEWVLAVPPLRADDAVALFTERAASVLPTFRLTEHNTSAVAAICAALDGSPLAIELAAARMSVLSPGEVLARLDDRYRLLTKGAPGAPEHQRSLRASVEVTFEACTPEEQRLWTRASVFAGGFDLAAAEAVCSGDGLEEWAVLDLVDTLLERSVLGREDVDEAHVRYRMPETLRAYGVERLGPDAEHRRDRHLEWCALMADRARPEWFGPGQTELLGRLRSEVPNLRIALDHALADPTRSPRALRILVGLEPFWAFAGLLDQAQQWVDRALAHPTGSRADRTRAGVLGCWAELLRDGAPGCDAGPLAPAGPVAPELVEAAEARLWATEELTGDDTGTPDGAAGAAVLRVRALVAALHGEPAEETLHEAVRRAAAAGDRWGEAVGLLLLGTVAQLEGRTADAVSAHERCARHCRRAGETLLRSTALLLLARDALDRAEPDRAHALASEALTLRNGTGDTAGVTTILELLGRVALGRGEHERGSLLLGAVARSRGVESHDVDATGADPDLVRRGASLTTAEAVGYALHGLLPDARPPEPETPLTRRELEVAELVAAGAPNREVAHTLGISPRTAQGHVESILRKLGFSSRTQVATWVAERRAGDPGRGGSATSQ